MRRLLRWYGANPLHLLALLGSFALAGYAAARLVPSRPLGVAAWFLGAVVGHDLLLMPLYALADRSAMAAIRHRAPRLPAAPWINYLRVPAGLSALLLLVWFPLILRLHTSYSASTTLSADPYLWHWLAVTGALFLLSAVMLALRLRMRPRAVTALEPRPAPSGAEDATATRENPAASRHSSTDGNPADGSAGRTDLRKKHTVTRQSMAEQVAAMNEAAAARPANPVMSVFADEQPRLAREPAPAVPPGPGAPAPDGELLDVHGQPVTLHAALAGGPAVLVFYRGEWCPYCNIALATYQAQLLPELRRRGFGLIAVSPQKPDESLALQEKKELTFTVLSDPGNVLAAQFGIVMTPSPDVIEAQLKLGLDLTQGNADGTTAIPIPTTVVIDADRVVRWVDVRPDYSTRSEVSDILAAIDAAGSGSAR
jgi:peroxiredoxin